MIVMLKEFYDITCYTTNSSLHRIIGEQSNIRSSVDNVTPSASIIVGGVLDWMI